MGEGDFARAGVGAAAEQSSVGDGVVRRTERACGEKGVFVIEKSGDGVNLGRFDGFGFRHGWHDAGEAFGEHRFTGARGADHQDVVSTSDGDFESAFDVVLAFDVGKVREVFVAVASKESRAIPRSFAWMAMGRIPFTGRVEPSSDSSPTMSDFSGLGISQSIPVAMSARAIGRSKEGPSFLRSAGARLMVLVP